MTESICLNPYIFGTDKERNKRGVCAFETARKIRKLWAERSEEFEKQFGVVDSDFKQAISAKPFQRRPFGELGAPDAFKEFFPTVVSLALYDGEEQIFECSGIAVQTGESTNGLTRFLTSERLVAVFNDMRNRKDELRIEVGLPFAGMGPIDGFLEIYDDDIAIVTSLLSRADVIPLYLYREDKYLHHATPVVAAGRQFMSHTWRHQSGKLLTPSEGDLGYSDCQILEHGLGGPLLLVHPRDDAGIYFVGINIRYAEGKTMFLPCKIIRERLEQYQILTPRDLDGGDDSGQEDVEGGYDSGQEDVEGGYDSGQEDVEEGDDSRQEETDDTSPYGVGSSSGTNEICYQDYSPPAGAKVIVPSGFMRKLKWLDAMGYPKPPPLMLELNGELLHTFEDFFGYLFAWRGYPFNLSFCGEGPNPWGRLDSNIIKTVSRSVVSLSSFHVFDLDQIMTKAMTCRCQEIVCVYRLAYKMQVDRHYGSVVPSRTVILTSASLVRTHDASAIDEKLKIEVFLPPKQRVNGALLAYDSCYNLAIVSVEGLRSICPEDVLLADTPQDQSKDRQLRKMCREEPELKSVVAIGREPEGGLLCGSMGIVSTDPVTRGCKDLRLSTCKIKKAGIGGPLINFADGSFVGMNFYDGRTDSTPFLPRRYILKVLHKLELPPPGGDRDDHVVQRLDSSDDGMNQDNIWHVPKARWYHNLLEVG